MDRIRIFPTEDDYWMVHLESKPSGWKFPSLDEALSSAIATVSFTEEGKITQIIIQDHSGNWRSHWSYLIDQFPSA